jgi:hypothetical protein
LKLARRADDVNADKEIFTDHYRHCINHGFKKLQQYYTKIDESRLYSAVVALNPSMRFHYFKTQWSKKPGGKQAIKDAKR